MLYPAYDLTPLFLPENIQFAESYYHGTKFYLLNNTKSLINDIVFIGN